MRALFFGLFAASFVVASILTASSRPAAQGTAQPATGQVEPPAVPIGLPPLFLREAWRQRDRPPDAAADFVPEGGVTSAAVTNADLELRLYDPNAKNVAAYLKQPPTGSIAS